MILDWLKTKEKLDLLFHVLESIEWGLREEKAKTVVCIICEIIINFERVGTYESEVIFIQKLSLYRTGVRILKNNNTGMTFPTKMPLSKNLPPNYPRVRYPPGLVQQTDHHHFLLLIDHIF